MLRSDRLSEIDEKIKAWIAGPEEEGPSPVLPYDEQLVAFIDILGVKDKVRKEAVYDAAEVVAVMKQIRTYVETECSPLAKAGRLRSLQIGDGFFIISDIDCINEICEILSTVQWHVLVHSLMLLRGVLTAGKVAVEEERCFIGPAIIDALELERRNAIYPRIIYEDKSIERHVNRKDVKFRHIREDQDKIKYLDFIQYNMDTEQFTGETLGQLLTEKEVTRTLEEVYKNKISEDRDTAQKYGWLITKLAEHGIEII